MRTNIRVQHLMTWKNFSINQNKKFSILLSFPLNHDTVALEENILSLIAAHYFVHFQLY